MQASQFISQSKTHNTNKEFQVQDYLQDRVYKDRMNKDKIYRELNRYSDICVYNDTRVILNKRPPALDSQ
jgi:protein tyrosine phosphatase